MFFKIQVLLIHLTDIPKALEIRFAWRIKLSVVRLYLTKPF